MENAIHLMADDKPYFPTPSKRDERSNPYRAASTAREEDSAGRIVARPEPPPPDTLEDEASTTRAAENAKRIVKLSPEEIRALLAVESANRGSWRKSARRFVVVVPVGLIGSLLHGVFGSYALAFSIVLSIGVIAWSASPLFRRDGFSG